MSEPQAPATQPPPEQDTPPSRRGPRLRIHEAAVKELIQRVQAIDQRTERLVPDVASLKANVQALRHEVNRLEGQPPLGQRVAALEASSEAHVQAHNTADKQTRQLFGRPWWPQFFAPAVGVVASAVIGFFSAHAGSSAGH